MNKSLLTILIFLKDREDFTKRLCHYLSSIHYPYPILFADGSLTDENEIFLRKLSNVNFNFTYQRYPKDSCLSDFYRKCYLSSEMVKTPYVMLADNDDFLIPSGQQKCIDFLEQHPDYVGCNGRVSGVILSQNPQSTFGQHVQYLNYYCNTMDAPVLLEQTSAVDRIAAYLKNFYSIYYSVFRTEAVVHSFKKTLEFNFSELGIHELFFSYLQLTQGKIHTIPEITYIRQKGSSQAASTQRDWFYRLFYTNWLSDCQRGIDYVAERIAIIENQDKQVVYDRLYADLVSRMRARFLPNQYYLFKNLRQIFNKESLLLILMTKIFKKSPGLGEFLSRRLLNKTILQANFKAIKAAVTEASCTLPL